MTCDQVRDRIDLLLAATSAPDGEPETAEESLAPSARARLERHLAACPACAEELALARRLDAVLAGPLPLLSCPDAVTASVLATARAEAAAGSAVPAAPPSLRWHDRLADFWRAVRAPELAAAALRPAAALLVIVLLVAAPVAVWRSLAPESPGRSADATAPTAEPAGDPPTGDGTYSEAEIAAAEEEARLVLAYIASVSRDAGTTVREELFEEAIVDPMRRAAERDDETPRSER